MSVTAQLIQNVYTNPNTFFDLSWIKRNRINSGIILTITSFDNCLLEVFLSRVINPEGSGKERNRLVKSIVLAMRELMRQPEPNEKSRDLAAYIALALLEITNTVETSVAAWEKKGYWVKADRFRMDWAWTNRLGNQMREALMQDDWATIALVAAQVGGKFNNIDVPVRHRLGTPWEGAWQHLNKTA